MRWPWQRAERGPDAAAPAPPPHAPVPDAAPPVPPAGWAFLPPLQRQVSDAPPAVMRPAFVSTLPTRTVPASLGVMGHLVDDHAPAGTVAVDGGALGAPVQRAVVSELTLRPGQAGAPRSLSPALTVMQRSTDATGALPLEDAPAPTPASGESGTEPATEEPMPEQRALAEHEPTGGAPRFDDAHAIEPGATSSASTRAADAADPTTTGRGLIGEAAAVTVSRLAEQSTPRAASVPDVVSPPLQAPRRAGLGAPLPADPPPLQRATAQAGGAPSHPVQSGPTAPVAQRSAEAGSEPPAPGMSLPSRDRAVDESGTSTVEAPGPVELPDVDSESAPEQYAPLLAETATALTETAPMAGGLASDAPTIRPASAGSAPLAPSPRTAVQRDVEAGAEPSAHEAPGPGSHDAPDAAPAVGAGRREGSTAAPMPVVQRSVPLVAERRIVPSLAAPTGPRPGAPHGRVVVARVVAPQSPTTSGGERTRASAAKVPGDAPAPATLSATAAGFGGAPGGGAPGVLRGATGAAADDPWTAEAPAVVASVARLTTAPIATAARTRPAGTAAAQPPREPMPVAAAAMHQAAATVQRSLEPGVTGSAHDSMAGEGSDAADRTATPSTTTVGGVHSASGGSTDVVVQSAPAPASTSTAAPAAPAAGAENVEQLVRKLYGPLVRRIKAELLLDRERRGIRIDGI